MSVQRSKLKAQDLLSKGSSSSSTAIHKEEGELEEESKGGWRWWEWSSLTMLLVVTTSSTCKSVTGEGSGFRGARGTRGKPGVRVLDAMYLGEICEDPGPSDGVRVERGDKEGGVWPKPVAI